MSLRTNTRTGGLPSNPRSRGNQTQTVQQPARDDYYSDAGSRSYDRAGQRDYGSGQSAQRSDRGRDYDNYDRGYASSNAGYSDSGRGGGGGGRQDYASSTTSSSASSSLLDRMKQRSNVSSARTSVEEDQYQAQSKSNSLRAGGRSLRAPPQQQQRDPEPDQYYDDGPVPSGEGSSLWGRMVSAAGSLKVNVSTALSNVTREDGEETPPGTDSRLTRAMKEYYLRKARDPNDLPSWLFDDAERRSTASSAARAPSASRSRAPANEPPPSRSGNLRDIYDRAATGGAASSRSGASSTLTVTTDTGYAGGAGGGLSPSPGLGRSATRAETRLKAMREAKRTQLGGTAVRDNYDAAYRQDSGGGGGGGGREDRYSGGRDDRYGGGGGGGRDDYSSSRGGGYGGGGGDPYGGMHDDYAPSRGGGGGGYSGGYSDSGYAQDDRYNPPADDGRRPARVGLPSRPGRG